MKIFKFFLITAFLLTVFTHAHINNAEAKIYSSSGASLDVPDSFFYQKKDDPKSTTKFFVFRYKPGSVQFNPNLNLTIEAIPAGVTLADTKAYMDIAVKNVQTQLANMKIAYNPVPVTINGKVFYKYLYTSDINSNKLLISQYAYYNKKNRTVYVFTVGDVVDNYLKDAGALEQILKTVKID